MKVMELMGSGRILKALSRQTISVPGPLDIMPSTPGATYSSDRWCSQLCHYHAIGRQLWRELHQLIYFFCFQLLTFGFQPKLLCYKQSDFSALKRTELQL